MANPNYVPFRFDSLDTGAEFLKLVSGRDKDWMRRFRKLSDRRAICTDNSEIYHFRPTERVFKDMTDAHDAEARVMSAHYTYLAKHGT